MAASIAMGLFFLPAFLPPALAVDSDGDGVDDTIDCRPSDATTWYLSTEARSLAVTGGASTGFSWLAPSPAPGTTVYDVLRTNGPGSWASAVCLLSNTSATSAPALDPSTPSNVYFYLVRAKTACGGALGTNSSGTPTTGTSCSLADGQSCAVSAACTNGYCCSSLCANITSDVNNCGACGTACTNPNGPTSCLGSVCSPICNPGFKSCDFNPNNGCETNTASDINNCGNCGIHCNGTNGSPFCVNSACGIACNSGFLDCNGNLSDGCEVNRNSDPQNCNGCNNVCPGLGQTTANVACGGGVCQFSCVGENYDVDNNAIDGCEWLDNPTGNHTSANATNQGSHDCTDTTISWNGTVLSDSRVHSPAITGFNTNTGAAPDYSAITATGGAFCSNDFSFTLTTSGGGATTCYQLTVQTNATMQVCSTTGSGNCTVSFGAGAYASNSTVSVKVEKTCLLPIRERVNYIVQGHL